MQLVLDLGNSMQKYAVFSGDEMIELHAEKLLTIENLYAVIKKFQIKSCILASVVHHDSNLEKMLYENCNTIILNYTTPLPFKNLYASPETLGKDRLACAVAAWKTFPGKNVLALDAGTCIKYDFVSAEETYLGGAISPGLNMRFKALHNYTDKLPLLNTDMLGQKFLAITGDSTEHSILSGVGVGALLEVDGAIDRYRGKYKDLQVILTGGDASFFENHLKNRIFAVPNLVLQGLHVILDYNLKDN